MTTDLWAQRVAAVAVGAGVGIKAFSLQYVADRLAAAIGPGYEKYDDAAIGAALQAEQNTSRDQFLQPSTIQRRMTPVEALDHANAATAQREQAKQSDGKMTLTDKQRAAISTMTPSQKLHLANDAGAK